MLLLYKSAHTARAFHFKGVVSLIKEPNTPFFFSGTTILNLSNRIFFLISSRRLRPSLNETYDIEHVLVRGPRSLGQSILRIISEDSIKSVRPGFGLPPKFLKRVIGQKITMNISKNTPVKNEHLLNPIDL